MRQYARHCRQQLCSYRGNGNRKIKLQVLQGFESWFLDNVTGFCLALRRERHWFDEKGGIKERRCCLYIAASRPWILRSNPSDTSEALDHALTPYLVTSEIDCSNPKGFQMQSLMSFVNNGHDLPATCSASGGKRCS